MNPNDNEKFKTIPKQYVVNFENLLSNLIPQTLELEYYKRLMFAWYFYTLRKNGLSIIAREINTLTEEQKKAVKLQKDDGESFVTYMLIGYAAKKNMEELEKEMNTNHDCILDIAHIMNKCFCYYYPQASLEYRVTTLANYFFNFHIFNKTLQIFGKEDTIYFNMGICMANLGEEK